MNNEIQTQIDRLIALALEEDLGSRGDITSQALSDLNRPVTAKIVAKQKGIIAGLDVARRVFETITKNIEFNKCVSDGEEVEIAQTVAEISGAAIDVLKAERTALNFLQHLSGIATRTAQYVRAIQDTQAKVLDTRKTTPGMRGLEKYAVEKGGGKNHRHGLYDMILLKENHITAAGSIEAAISHARAYLQTQGYDAAIEIEVTGLQQLERVLPLDVDRIMLDNMTVADMTKAVKIAGGAVELEASGGVTLSNIRAIAESGVDYISVGALTHSVEALDLSLLLTDG